MVVGFTITSASDIAGNSIGNPPACSTPRFTSSARWCRCVWQGLMSLQVLMIAMTGRPAQSVVSYPTWRSRERWPKERRSLTPSQRWLRRSSARLRLAMGMASLDSEVEVLDQRAPLLALGHDELTEALAVGHHRIGDHRGHPLFHDGFLRDRLRGLLDLGDHLVRHAGAHADTEPRGGVIARHRFGNRRKIGKERGALE